MQQASPDPLTTPTTTTTNHLRKRTRAHTNLKLHSVFVVKLLFIVLTLQFFLFPSGQLVP